MADNKTINEVEEVEVKTTIETPDKSIVDPSKIAVNADVVEETPKEETKLASKKTTKSPKAPKVPNTESKGDDDAKEEDPFDTDEFEVKIAKATGINHPYIDKLISDIKEAKDDETKEAAKKHLIWHIPAGAGCEHHDDLVAEVNAL